MPDRLYKKLNTHNTTPWPECNSIVWPGCLTPRAAEPDIEVSETQDFPPAPVSISSPSPCPRLAACFAVQVND